MLENEAENSVYRNPISTLIAFKPRQVMLAEQSARKTMAKNEATRKTSTPTPHQKALLLHSVLRYLDRNCFSKTLKRFLSEAQIENDDWRTSSLDLEDMCCQYLEKCGQVGINPNNTLEQDSFTKANGDASEKAVSKNVADDGEVGELEAKPKEKKKNKKKSDSLAPSEQVSVEEQEEEGEDKIKKKKKKSEANSEQQQLDSLSEESKDLANSKGDCNTDSEPKTKSKDKKKKSKPTDENVGTEEKASKKRKRKASNENEDEPVEKVGAEDTKRQKTEISKKTTSTEDVKQFDAEANGMLEKNNGEKSALQKSKKKPQNGSAEPKNAFQRVKIDDVNFADERLQDNSYWAKDGADIGYGAKAQEVLGQVRGRDFRHEKTKKKRGSYRGGLIDLDSHSIKFNYSDEE